MSELDYLYVPFAERMNEFPNLGLSTVELTFQIPELENLRRDNVELGLGLGLV